MKRALYLIVEAAMLPALLALIFVYIWLLAPAGAAYPR